MRLSILLAGLLLSGPAASADTPDTIAGPTSGADEVYRDALWERASAAKVWEERYWRLLLHYRRGLTGTYSDASSPEFFLSPRGRQDPKAELEATLTAMLSPGDGGADEHAQCRFPARWAWLKERLALDPARFEERTCAAFDAWRGELDPQAASLVFASSYLNNPSSMYGHTFFLLERAGSTNRLLDRTVNFAADVDTNNGILFAVYGIIGLFPGRFSVMPYYLKIQQYNQLENRDLWEYRLSLSPEAIERLLRHLWELDRARFPYYFFNKNCSYQILPVLEVAEPTLRLTEHWPLYVIPADTVRALLGQPGLVTERSFRPSHRTRMFARRSRLSEREVEVVEDIVESKGEDGGFAALGALPVERQAEVLESASEYLEYRVDYRRPGEAVEKLQRRIHVARGRLGIPAVPVPPPAQPPLEAGHDTTRVTLGYGSRGSSSFAELSLRFSLHDLLDRPHGYNADSTLELGSLRVRRDDDAGRTYLQNLDVVRIVSLSPRDRWYRKKSWKVSTGFDVATELGGDPWDSLYYGVNLGSGRAFQGRFLGRQLVYGMIEADLGVGGVFEGNARVGGGASAGLVTEPVPWLRARGEASYLDYALGDRRSNRRLRAEATLCPFKDAALRVSWEKRGETAGETSVALHAFF